MRTFLVSRFVPITFPSKWDVIFHRSHLKTNVLLHDPALSFSTLPSRLHLSHDVQLLRVSGHLEGSRED